MPTFSIAAGKAVSQRARINAIRDQLEVAPIEITYSGLFGSTTIALDCDERSELRMRDTIDNWLSLGVSTIDWVLADNSTEQVSLPGLSSVFSKMIEARTQRALALHNYARGLKATLPVADNSVIFEAGSWVY